MSLQPSYGVPTRTSEFQLNGKAVGNGDAIPFVSGKFCENTENFPETHKRKFHDQQGQVH